MLYGFKYLWKCILKVWYPLVNFLDDSWAVVSTSILKLGNNLWYGLLVGLKYIGNAMQKAWNYIWDGIVSAFEKQFWKSRKPGFGQKACLIPRNLSTLKSLSLSVNISDVVTPGDSNLPTLSANPNGSSTLSTRNGQRLTKALTTR